MRRLDRMSYLYVCASIILPIPPVDIQRLEIPKILKYLVRMEFSSVAEQSNALKLGLSGSLGSKTAADTDSDGTGRVTCA